MRRFVGRAVTVLSAAALAITGVLAAGIGPAQAAEPQAATYVSLGDSLAFGYQPNLVAAGDFKPADYVSYAEDYAAAQQRHLKVANFGCPGETTGSMINGGCPWLDSQQPQRYSNGYPLHMSYGPYSSQLDAAVAYLKAHRQTTLVSVDLGSNDLIAILGQCGLNVTCISGELPAVFANYADILGQIKAAAPQAKLVLFNIYNPYALALPGSDGLLIGLVNPLIDQLAAVYGASVADAFTAINHNPNPIYGGSEFASVCALTWMCTFTPPNIHPTDLGYAAMEEALQAALQ